MVERERFLVMRTDKARRKEARRRERAGEEASECRIRAWVQLSRSAQQLDWSDRLASSCCFCDGGRELDQRVVLCRESWSEG